LPPPPSAPVDDALERRRLIFVGGKGGVGKTTVAAALGVTAAGRGRRCLVVSTDPAHSLADVYDRPIGGREAPLGDRLAGLEIDPEAEAERHIEAVKQQMKSLVHPRMYGEVERQLDLARLAPGTMEAALLERMAELMAEAGARFDLVIFDTAPTGHTLRLLSLPEIMMAWTEGLLRHRERSSRLAAVLRRFGGGAARGDELSMIDAPADHAEGSRAEKLQQILGNRQRKLRHARELLLDGTATAFFLVLNPDKLSILESRKALEALDRAGVPVAAVVVNRVLPAEAAGEFLERRRQQEAFYLQQIADEFGRLPRVALPLLPDDVHGAEALRRIGEMLTGARPT
jgi:arsenite-transporting ATPase